MGQDGLAAVGAGAPLRLCQRIVGAPLVLDSLRGSFFGTGIILVLSFSAF